MDANIDGYPNYHITSDGRVFNIKTGRCLSAAKDTGGYLILRLCKNGSGKMFLIHRLVATAYLPNPNNLPVVMHLDDDIENNNVSNLRWGSHADNSQDMASKKRGGWHGRFGEKHASAKLSDKQRIEIREKYKTGNYTQKELGMLYSVDQGLISKITRNSK